MPVGDSTTALISSQL